MTQHDLILTLRALCSTHVDRNGGNLSLVYGDLLLELPNIIARYGDGSYEFYVGIRPYGFECCCTEQTLREKLSVFTLQGISMYRIEVTVLESGFCEYVVTYIADLRRK